MCWTCDHPGADRVDYLDHVRKLITAHRWAVQGVERDRWRPSWAYTVGLTPLGHPEIVVTGMPLQPAADLLNDAAAHAVREGLPEAGEQIPLRGGPLAEIVELAHPEVHLEVAVALYGSDVRALQLVRADERGRFPWEPGHRAGRGGQPVLGPRAPAR
ncbi:MAG TPA: DUF4262 domain-containing protein [Mycobacteriales bacterium]|nr:DUF4262 domain-containing protein [Mycobacteriales bacterium]